MIRSQRILAAAAVVMLPVLSGCRKASFEVQTSAPPGTVATYAEDKDRRSIGLSQGVAIGIACKDDESRPCSLDGTVVDDGEIAAWYKGFSASLDTRYDAQATSGTKKEQRAVFFVVGKKPGKTTVRVRTGRGDLPIDVEVFGAPQ